MIVKQYLFKESQGWKDNLDQNFSPDLIIIFGARNLLSDTNLKSITSVWPNAISFGCSTSGEIFDTNVFTDSITVSAIKFSKTTLSYFDIDIDDSKNSKVIGEKLIQHIPSKGLRHVLVLSDGLNINGSELVEGMRKSNPVNVNITGGLAGDGDKFQETFIINNKGEVLKSKVGAVAFYGDSLEIGFGSYGGWDVFGMERHVTKSERNILYEIDGKPALELYKSFLGEQAKNLPASALLFPLSVRTSPDQPPVVRTILSIDEAHQSLTFAGDIPQGSYARLMKANNDRLIHGAHQAAVEASGTSNQPLFAVLISCVGRRLILKQIVEEEVEAVKDVLPKGSTLAGFYSYGEISPFSHQALDCALHNQTMTVTTFYEK
jgi:hypothetical protein